MRIGIHVFWSYMDNWVWSCADWFVLAVHWQNWLVQTWLLWTGFNRLTKCTDWSKSVNHIWPKVSMNLFEKVHGLLWFNANTCQMHRLTWLNENISQMHSMTGSMKTMAKCTVWLDRWKTRINKCCLHCKDSKISTKCIQSPYFDLHYENWNACILVIYGQLSLKLCWLVCLSSPLTKLACTDLATVDWF